MASLIGSGLSSGVKPRPQQGIQTTYDAAATQQAGDYDSIMQGYRDLLGDARGLGPGGTTGGGSSNLNFVPINPVFNSSVNGSPYQRTAELGEAMQGYSGLSKTGGYSDADVSNIRERGLAPIRSIYSTAQNDARRQKVLQGGYSPNSGAVTAKLARESAGVLGGMSTKVNADVAQMIASGRLSGLAGLGNLADRENTLINSNNQRNSDMAAQVAAYNADVANKTNQFNAQGKANTDQFNATNQQNGLGAQQNALQGMTSLYGTTPALTQTFGNQVLANNAQQMQANTTANQLKNQRAGSLIGAVR